MMVVMYVRGVQPVGLNAIEGDPETSLSCLGSSCVLLPMSPF